MIASEVGALRRVVLHRPGLELRRLTPANKEELLFDELLWVSKAQEEHDAFADALRAEAVEVLMLADLLVDVLADEGAKHALIDRIATADVCGVELVDRVGGHLRDLSPPDLVDHLIGGLTIDEIPGADGGFVGGVLGPHAFILPPLPNAVFTRDPTARIGEGVVLCPMQRPARQAERVIWQEVCRHHPAMQPAGGFWYGDEERSYGAATIEGGDVLVLSSDCVAIGLSQRTHPIAAENLAARLFEAGVARWVLAIDLPKTRGTMHLDTVMTIVDRDAVVIWPRARQLLQAHRIEPGGGGRMAVREEPDLLRAIADGLGADPLRVIMTAEDELSADREQWDDGNNTLAVRPGVVVAYERNVDTNRRLADEGIEVRAISSYELPRGRGGPRCMSCPLERDPL